MKKFEELLDKRNLEIVLESKVQDAEKERKELELEYAIKEKQRNEARERTDSINHSESLVKGIFFGIIGAFIGFFFGGLIGFALWLIIMIFGSDNESIISIVAVIGLLIGGLSGFAMGYDDIRVKK